MNAWGQQASDRLLCESWASFQTAAAPLLVKIALDDSPRGLSLAFLATDTRSVHYEHLNERQLVSRFADAFANSQLDTPHSQSTFATLGDEGDQQLRAGLQQLVGAIYDGSAGVSVEDSAYEYLVTVKLPDFTLRFVCESLEKQGADALSTHLLTPLLGLSSALLSLVHNSAVVEDGSLEAAVDASARAERLREGRAAQVFFGVGGSALGRWMSRFAAIKERDMMPITLSATSRRHSPIASTSTVSTSSTQSPSKRNLIAKQLLDHKSEQPGATADRAQWDNSQDAGPRPSFEAYATSTARLSVRSQEDEEKTEKPASEEEAESFPFPPAQQPPSSASKMDVDLPDSTTTGEGEAGEDEEPVTDEDDGLSPTFAQSQSQPPAPTPLTPPDSTVEAERKRQKSKRKEHEMEVEVRRQIKAAQKAKAKAIVGAVKKKKKL